MKTSFKTNKLEINVSWKFRIKPCYETFQNKTTQARTEKIRNRKRRNKLVAPHEGKEETLPRPEVPYVMSILSSRRGNMEVRQALRSAKFSGVTV
jgi:hypothetical protein